MASYENDTIDACIERLVTAWNGRDAEAYGADFTETATNITYFGEVFFNREDMVAKLGSMMTMMPPELTMTMKVLNVVDLAETVKLATMITGVGFGQSYPLDKLQTAVFVKSDNRWLCAAYQNTSMSDETQAVYNSAA